MSDRRHYYYCAPRSGRQGFADWPPVCGKDTFRVACGRSGMRADRLVAAGLLRRISARDAWRFPDAIFDEEVDISNILEDECLKLDEVRDV